MRCKIYPQIFCLWMRSILRRKEENVSPHLTTRKKHGKRLPIPDEIQGTAEKICQVSPLKVETKLLQTTEIEKKTRHFQLKQTQIFHRHRLLFRQNRT